MMFVMLAVFVGLSYFRQKSNPRTVSPNAPTAQTQPAQQPPPAAPTAAQSAAVTGQPAAPVVQAEAEATTVVENELYRIEFTNRGGQVRSWILKQFMDSDRKPLNIVHTQAAEQF